MKSAVNYHPYDINSNIKPMNFTITDQEFSRFRSFIFEIAGIDLAPAKKAMVSSRLAKRLRHYSLDNYGAYFNLLMRGEHPEEKQILIDLLTTNETYFFREPAHFDFLQKTILPGWRRNGTFRVWSGASSSGQEAYSIGMVLADQLRQSPWEIVGTDLSSRVLETARLGHYPMSRIEGIPKDYLRRFCLRGTGPYEDTLLVDSTIRNRVKFVHANLNTALPDLGAFDVIFLRNVMIYFNQETKTEIVRRMLAFLKPGGFFIIGHSETLKGINDTLNSVAPTIYQKPQKSDVNPGVKRNADDLVAAQ